MAIKVISDKCKGCTICVKACPFTAIEMKAKVAEIGSACTSCGVCVAKCPFDAIEKIESENANSVDLSQYKDVWVFAEQRQGKLMGVALELIGEGYRLAKKISKDTKVWAHVPMRPFPPAFSTASYCTDRFRWPQGVRQGTNYQRTA